MTQEFTDRIKTYFTGRLGWGEVKVTEAKRLTGGISRETWRITLDAAGDHGKKVERGVILRLDPEAETQAATAAGQNQRRAWRLSSGELPLPPGRIG